MRCACIDIGSNTTRVLVADVLDGRLEPVLVAKAFTRLGRELRRTGELPDAAVRHVAAVVAEQHEAAVRAGAAVVRVVATAAIRGAPNGAGLCTAVREAAGLPVEVLTGEQEARLAFSGATRTLERELDPDLRLAVVDVGGGSSEIAVGTARGGVAWWGSVPLGSGSLAEHCLRSDPPGDDELAEAGAEAEAAFAGMDVPDVALAIAVGGSATSTAQLVGPLVAPAPVRAALEVLCSAPADQVARAYALDAERVRVLPAGLHLLAAAAGRLRRPLEVGRGGLREGVLFELAARP
jgi:exopolyphosphatase/guanosine-5'-triphosphate,3'-diphosphate pyrophosphatase